MVNNAAHDVALGLFRNVSITEAPSGNFDDLFSLWCHHHPPGCAGGGSNIKSSNVVVASATKFKCLTGFLLPPFLPLFSLKAMKSLLYWRTFAVLYWWCSRIAAGVDLLTADVVASLLQCTNGDGGGKTLRRAFLDAVSPGVLNWEKQLDSATAR